MANSRKEQFYIENENLVYFVFNKYMSGIPSNEDIKEDLLQEGRNALWKCLDTYDSEKSKFSTYAIIVIRRAMLYYAKRYFTDTKDVVPFDEVPFPSTEDGEGIVLSETIDDGTHSHFQKTYMLKNIFTKVYSRSNPITKKIVSCYMRNLKQSDIAKATGVNQSYVSRNLRKFQEECRREYDLCK